MSKEAMKLALEALEGALSDDKPYIEKSKQAVTALREALAEQPQQEPVAWLHKVTKLMVHADEIAKTSRNEDRINSGEFQALYTSPPAQRKPLTDEELDAMFSKTLKGKKLVNWVARAIEAAHGIKENT